MTPSSVTSVQVTRSGPARTLRPRLHARLLSPTRRLARPLPISSMEIVVPKTRAEDPLPARVTEHELPEQDTMLTLA